MEHLKATKDLLQKQLAEIEAKMASLTVKSASDIMTDEEFQQKVVDMYEDEAWKSFAGKHCGVVSNIADILDDCYDSYVETIEEEYPDKSYKTLIGKQKSLKWQQFKLKVIASLIDPSKMDDEFEDTAGGCDEIAWDAGLEIIRELAK
jgi:hypothetical protein